MPISVANDTCVCPSCGKQRIVTVRQARRAHQQGGIPCQTCRGLNPSRYKVKDTDLRYWLNRYGTRVPHNTPVRDFIAAGGAPHDLVNLAQTIFPPH